MISVRHIYLKSSLFKTSNGRDKVWAIYSRQETMILLINRGMKSNYNHSFARERGKVEQDSAKIMRKEQYTFHVMSWLENKVHPALRPSGVFFVAKCNSIREVRRSVFNLVNSTTLNVSLMSFMQIRFKTPFLQLNIDSSFRQFIRPKFITNSNLSLLHWKMANLGNSRRTLLYIPMRFNLHWFLGFYEYECFS